jgi:hypothetical protein
MGGSTSRLRCAALALALTACRDPPPPEPIELGTASSTAREVVDEATDVHDYIAAYRRVLRMDLRPAEAQRVLGVDVAGTSRGDATFLGILAADYTARQIVPLALDAASFREEATQLRQSTAVADRAGARRTAAAIERVRDRVGRQRQAQHETNPEMLATIGLILTEAGAALDDISSAEPVPRHAERVAKTFILLISLYPDPAAREAVVGAAVSLLRDLTAAAKSGVNNGTPSPYPAPGVAPPPPAEEGP